LSDIDLNSVIRRCSRGWY